jgi:hypothetical protein
MSDGSYTARMPSPWPISTGFVRGVRSLVPCTWATNVKKRSVFLAISNRTTCPFASSRVPWVADLLRGSRRSPSFPHGLWTVWKLAETLRHDPPAPRMVATRIGNQCSGS